MDDAIERGKARDSGLIASLPYVRVAVEQLECDGCGRVEMTYRLGRSTVDTLDPPG